MHVLISALLHRIVGVGLCCRAQAPGRPRNVTWPTCQQGPPPSVEVGVNLIDFVPLWTFSVLPRSLVPPYDQSDITALLAHRVVLEALSGMALRKLGRETRPEHT